MTSRRAFLQSTAAGAGAVLITGAWKHALSSSDGPLIDGVAAACARLAPLGWRQMLLDATNGALDIGARDLRAQLTKPLARIDRSYPGFGDFNIAGTRGIEAGKPDQSLLYHAFASPAVVANRAGVALRGFPTLAEIDAVENFVYGVTPPSLAALQQRAGGKPMAIAMFALQYRNTPNSVHGKHAELVFARTGISRLGTIEPQYNARMRMFDFIDSTRPFDFRAVPQRYAAYIAVQMNGDRSKFGPQDALPGDDKLSFWVPIHKLYSGKECVEGMDLALELRRDLRNDELAQFHKWLDINGYQNNYRGEDLENFPFLIRNEHIASFSSRREFGPGVIEPRPAPLANEAQYQGKPLTFPVDPTFTDDPADLEFSSAQIIPGLPTTSPAYMFDTSPDTQRPAPEYLNIRHRVTANNKIENLNLRPDMMDIIKAGNYQTLHYIDFTGDGWVEARCTQLDAAIPLRVPAYCVVGPPDFFPKVSQRDLMLWWKSAVPHAVRDALWAIPPLTLSQTRIAANINLPINFSINDTTVTAMITQPSTSTGPVQMPNGPVPEEQTGMPDASPGIFDPGWDTSQGIYFSDPDVPLQKFLSGYALGAPFVEDAKLCAALGAYWPGVSPDATRTFQPNKILGGISYPWPTIIPLTDAEIGIEPAANGKYMPWDGVRGPEIRMVDGKALVAYPDAMRADYLDLLGTMTAALTARVDLAEYKARVMAMSSVYWALGIHDPEIMKMHPGKHDDGMIAIMAAKSKWAVRSFKTVPPNDRELVAALKTATNGGGEKASRARFTGPYRYRFEVFRWGKQMPDPTDLSKVLVEQLETAEVYVDGTSVMVRRDKGAWTIDSSMPTS